MALEFFVFDSQLGEVLLVIMEVTNFDQRRPKLERGVNDADHVVDNAGDVLLKKIWLKAVEATREISAKSVSAWRRFAFFVFLADSRTC